MNLKKWQLGALGFLLPWWLALGPLAARWAAPWLRGRAWEWLVVACGVVVVACVCASLVVWGDEPPSRFKPAAMWFWLGLGSVLVSGVALALRSWF